MTGFIKPLARIQQKVLGQIPIVGKSFAQNSFAHGGYHAKEFEQEAADSANQRRRKKNAMRIAGRDGGTPAEQSAAVKRLLGGG